MTIILPPTFKHSYTVKKLIKNNNIKVKTQINSTINNNFRINLSQAKLK